MPAADRLAPTALMLGNVVTGCSVLAPAGMLQKKDLPPRWGLLSLGEGGISVVAKAAWQEQAQVGYVESAIATTLPVVRLGAALKMPTPSAR